MKRILWVCNTPLPEIQRKVGVKQYNEGWLIGISNQLRQRKDIDFHYAFPQTRYKETLECTIDGITFWGFYDYHKNMYKIEKEGIEIFRSIIKKINPDIIHIFGTEYPHALECVSSISNKGKIIISLQGLTSEIAKVYMNGIPLEDRLMGQFKSGRYKCLITEQYDFYRRGVNERKILSSIKNVIGRTDWDRKFLEKINPECRYYHCNETLRDVFYEETWNLEEIQRHSIFISQAYYPIKGLHILISALPLIKRRYPDTMVYVAGWKKFEDEHTPYGHYIRKLLRKYHVEKDIVSVGYLVDEKMKQRLLKTHIMLMPSIIENSPNSIGEAMLLGTPVVAADVGGISSILHDKIEGYLYPCMDKKKLAKKICKIFESDKLALYFSRNGKKRAKELYSKSHNIEQLIEIYQAVGDRDKK